VDNVRSIFWVTIENMKRIILLFLLMLFFTNAMAATAFVVKKIDIEGLQRISRETVDTYLPIKVGERLTPSENASIIRSLYNTGFFDNISLSRDGDTLIVHVVERPTIGQIKITGNSVVPKDKLLEVMRSVNIIEGRPFDRAILDKIKLSLLNQYYQLGRYNARVDAKVTTMERNRVLVEIEISEGLIAKVRSINFIGNHAFHEKVLNKQLTISTPGLFTFFTQKDQYAQEKLDASLENIRNFYLDRGYLRFDIKSSQAAITPDRKSIFVTIVVDEGEPYTVSGYDLTGDLILPREELEKYIRIKKGDIFSKKKLVESEKLISEALGAKGYVFADISVKPNIDDVKKEVFVTFIIKPKKRAYVRSITFTDNAKTNDEVLRREIEQMESSVVSTSRLQQSKTRLQRLPNIKDVEMSIKPVKESDDEVDVNYKVTEDSAATANFSVGYSQLDHILLNAGFNQKNFLGTGNTLGFNLSRSRYQQYYGVTYMNPYFTDDGISRSLSLAYTHYDPEFANSSKSYKTNQLSFSDVFGIPIGQERGVFNRLQIGYGYENTVLHVSDNPSVQVGDFVEEHGRHFQQFDIFTGFSRDSRDRYIFPTRGMLHVVSANAFLPLTTGNLKYYNLDYKAKWYQPLTSKFITLTKAEVGYGNSFGGNAKNFPFFKNYYAGGIDTVRGYAGNTLGPEDSKGKPTGGNFLVNGSFGLIFPNFVSDNLRTTAFVDAGNVYDTFNNEDFAGTKSGPIRYSVGVEADWLTPMGLIDISLAKPLNLRGGDSEEIFQFALGANFG